MNKEQLREQAEHLEEAANKIGEAIKEARAAFEAAAELNGDERCQEMGEELARTLLTLRAAKRELDQKSCWLGYEALNAKEER